MKMFCKRFVVPLLLVFIISGAVIYSTVDIHTLKNLTSFQPWSIALALLCVSLGLTLDGTRLMHLVKISGEHITLGQAVQVVFGNYFLALLTPGATGGAVAQLMFLRRAGVPAGKATVLVIVRTLVSILFLICCMPFIFLHDAGILPGIDNRTLMLLVGCGATAAVSGIFKAPIAGLVFTLEVLMVDLTMASLLPILISSVTATCFSYFFTGGSPMYHFQMDYLWSLERVPPTILLGIACGFISLYFMRLMSWCENGYGKLSKYPYLKLLVGGLVLSSLIFLFPSLYGEGYNSLRLFIEGKTEADWMQVMSGSMFAGQTNLLVLYVGFVMLTKVFATSATNGAGGCGGTFAPALFIGGFGGFFFARLWNIQQLGVYVPEKNFTLYGMAAVMAAVMHAPLTGIFLIAELTGGYQLFIPLIIVTICSYLTINIFEHHSIYAVRLAKQGKLLTHHTDKSILTLMTMDKIIDRDFTSVAPDMEMGQLVHALSSSRNDYIPVLNESGCLMGEIDITKLRHIIFRTELYHRFHVSQLMTAPAATLGVNDPMEDVMKTFDSTGAQYLPVVGVDGHLVGYISRIRLYSMYRQFVADFSAE